MTPQRALIAYALKEPVKVKMRYGDARGVITSVEVSRFKPRSLPDRIGHGEKDKVCCSVLDPNGNSILVCSVSDVIETQAPPSDEYSKVIIDSILSLFKE